MNRIYSIYKTLFDLYGPQGWWPLTSCKRKNSKKTGGHNGYHISDYSFPKSNNEKFEICLGSILTQNTSWTSVETSLKNLGKLNSIEPQALLDLNIDDLKRAIKSSGYFNQKSSYIRTFSRFFISLNDRIPSREELLSIKGIGPETADSILLFAFKQSEFKVDAYTKRIFTALNLITEKAIYGEIKNLIERSLKKVTGNTEQLVIIFQEYHALLVEHAKRYYSKKPYALGCPLVNQYKFNKAQILIKKEKK